MKWALPPNDTYFGPILERTPEGFEIDHLKLALTHCKRRRCAIDGGAHVGTWTVALSQLFEKVYAFEPVPETADCLVQNVAKLCPRMNVSVVRAALSAREGLCGIEKDTLRPGNTGAYVVNEMWEEIPMITIDSLGLQNLDFLKLDVEGHESLALTGAENTIKRCQPTIVAECKAFSPPRNGGPELVRKMLRTLNYVEIGGIRNDRIFVPWTTQQST